MNDYCVGIAYGTGYFATDAKEPYLVVRNLDKWYVDVIASVTGYKPYKSSYNLDRDGKCQWVVKVRSVHAIPDLSKLQNPNDFCRAYIELHGILDMRTVNNQKGEYFKKPRLRIYGKEDVISFINTALPATEKKIQHIQNRVGVYTGKTCAIYYQSEREIFDILNWIYGSPRNDSVWDKWNHVLKTN